MTNIKKSIAEVQSSSKPTLILSKNLLSQISWLHNKVGKKEWSGLLFYKTVHGNINDIETWVLKADNIWFMDKGEPSTTSFATDNSIVDAMELCNPENDYKTGLIHSHQSMNCFFSGTDSEELQNNSPNHNYYLSLIVNFEMSPVAKIGVYLKTEAEATSKYKSTDDKEFLFTEDSELLYLIECKIVLECDEWFEQRFDKRVEETKKPAYIVPLGSYKNDYKQNSIDWDTEYPYQVKDYTQSFANSKVRDINDELLDSIGTESCKSVLFTWLNEVYYPGKKNLPELMGAIQSSKTNRKSKDVYREDLITYAKTFEKECYQRFVGVLKPQDYIDICQICMTFLSTTYNHFSCHKDLVMILNNIKVQNMQELSKSLQD